MTLFLIFSLVNTPKWPCMTADGFRQRSLGRLVTFFAGPGCVSWQSSTHTNGPWSGQSPRMNFPSHSSQTESWGSQDQWTSNFNITVISFGTLMSAPTKLVSLLTKTSSGFQTDDMSHNFPRPFPLPSHLSCMYNVHFQFLGLLQKCCNHREDNNKTECILKFLFNCNHNFHWTSATYYIDWGGNYQ